MRIYADTNIWNALCDQAVEPDKLTESLAMKDSSLALSPHTVYEIARTFGGKKAGSAERGKVLSAYISQFFRLGVACSKEIMELLLEEWRAFRLGLPHIDPWVEGQGYAIAADEANKLAQGIVEDRVRTFIISRQAFAGTTRTGQKDHLEARSDIRTQLKGIEPDRLSAWLHEQVLAPAGTKILCAHLLRIIQELDASFSHHQEFPAPIHAALMLQSPLAVAARGLVRVDLYYNWRCANRGSNPGDLMDDLLHVLQASYCDVYVTAEPKQFEYASILLAPRTGVGIYDGMTPIKNWLEGLS